MEPMNMKQQHRRVIIISILAVSTVLSTLVGRSRHAPGAAGVSPPAARALRRLGVGQFRDPRTSAPRPEAPVVGAPGAATATATAPPPTAFTVCGRAAAFDPVSWPRQQQYDDAARCPPFDPRRRTHVLRGTLAYGQTGNQLRSFLHAVQFARDKNIQLGIMHNSWAMKAILLFFMAANGEDGDGDDAWTSRLEESLCVKIFRQGDDLQEWNVDWLWSQNWQRAKKLFYYRSTAPREEYVASQLHALRTLFRHHNTGAGAPGGDMCAGIDALFANAGTEAAAGAGDPEEHRRVALFSVIHVRSFEGAGIKFLERTAKRTGCDPKAALEMRPEYVKAILAEGGLPAGPIVVISDDQRGSLKVLRRLLSDPDLGPRIRVIPKEARWLGGDVTLAVMATAFIGNPASSLSGFIARSRVALGLGQNYMYRARDEHGAWTTACSDDCLF